VLALGLYPALSSRDGPFIVFALVFGVSTSVTAFPVRDAFSSTADSTRATSTRSRSPGAAVDVPRGDRRKSLTAESR
jgi:hypothetical protein